jgi:hypothetical protein
MYPLRQGRPNGLALGKIERQIQSDLQTKKASQSPMGYFGFGQTGQGLRPMYQNLREEKISPK